MEKPFLTEKRREFVARAAMDVFKLLLPLSLATGLFVQPIPGIVKGGAVVGLAALFWLSVWLFPRGD